MRIQTTDRRERLWSQLEEATGEQHTSQALDTAARYYVTMRGDSPAVPTGVVNELLSAADDRGSLTASEIADILDTDQLPVKYAAEWSVGTE